MFGQKNFLVRKKFQLKNIFGQKIFFGAKKGNFWSKKFFGQKFIFPKYKFCQENCAKKFGQKRLFGPKKSVVVKKGVVLKKFGPSKKFRPKKV